MSRIQAKRLTEAEFQATVRAGMLDILGKEDQHGPGWVIDVSPYLEAIPDEDLASHPLLEGAPPAAVRRNSEGGYDHVLYPVRQDNTYLVVVVRFREEDVLGHYILDLRPSDPAP
ncbi:MAG: hypothetical protein GY719_21440 [bacterium]|nr:hypothetical protein [bacterium]